MKKEKMKSRSQLLEDLAWMKRPSAGIFAELSDFEDETENIYYILPVAAIVEVIDLRLSKKISEQELIQWGCYFEVREGFDYQENRTKEISEAVFCLANPEINFPLTDENLKMLRAKLAP